MIVSGARDNRPSGGAGKNVMTSGADSDEFNFDALDIGNSTTDFAACAVVVDQIVIDKSAFASFAEIPTVGQVTAKGWILRIGIDTTPRLTGVEVGFAVG